MTDAHNQYDIRAGSLLLYKQGPAVTRQVGAKLTIEQHSGKSVSVRPKDVVLLHPGPVQAVDRLLRRAEELEGEVEEALEVFEGEQTDVAEFAELAFGGWSPESAWAVVRMLQDGRDMTGDPWSITVRSAVERARIESERRAKAAEQQESEALLERIRRQALLPEDRDKFFDVENLAYGKTSSSRMLKALGITEEPEHAHALLLKLGIWDWYVDPMPARFGFSPEPASPPGLPEADPAGDAKRLDLTGLRSFAIDDAGSRDPDDAVSLDGSWVWVHVADAASVIPPGSQADERARAQGATLYLPEGGLTMLDSQLTDTLALGLQEISPALSFGIELSEAGEILDVRIAPSFIRAERFSYEDVHDRIDREPFGELYRRLLAYQQVRSQQGSIDLSLPEVKIRADRERGVEIRQLAPYDSQILVSNAMILAGEAAAMFAGREQIPFPYTVQMAPDTDAAPPEDLAGMYAFIRKMRPSEVRTAPDLHAGLGVTAYSRVTSPLRRYLDLLAHQQLRAYLAGEPLIDEDELTLRASAAFESARRAQQMERAANIHWKLVYLAEHPGWRGEAVVLSLKKQGAAAVIPELALEIFLPGLTHAEPNDVLPVELVSVDIPFHRTVFQTV